MAAVLAVALASLSRLGARLAGSSSYRARAARTRRTCETRQARISGRRPLGRGGDVSSSAPTTLTSPRCSPGCRAISGGCWRATAISERRLCRAAELCPALSLPNLFGPAALAEPCAIERCSTGCLRYFAQCGRSRATAGRPTIAFRVAAMPVERQEQLIDDMRAQLDPPAGVERRAGRAAGGCRRRPGRPRVEPAPAGLPVWLLVLAAAACWLPRGPGCRALVHR